MAAPGDAPATESGDGVDPEGEGGRDGVTHLPALVTSPGGPPCRTDARRIGHEDSAGSFFPGPHGPGGSGGKGLASAGQAPRATPHTGSGGGRYQPATASPRRSPSTTSHSVSPLMRAARFEGGLPREAGGRSTPSVQPAAYPRASSTPLKRSTSMPAASSRRNVSPSHGGYVSGGAHGASARMAGSGSREPKPWRLGRPTSTFSPSPVAPASASRGTSTTAMATSFPTVTIYESPRSGGGHLPPPAASPTAAATQAVLDELAAAMTYAGRGGGSGDESVIPAELGGLRVGDGDGAVPSTHGASPSHAATFIPASASDIIGKAVALRKRIQQHTMGDGGDHMDVGVTPSSGYGSRLPSLPSLAAWLADALPDLPPSSTATSASLLALTPEERSVTPTYALVDAGDAGADAVLEHWGMPQAGDGISSVVPPSAATRMPSGMAGLDDVIDGGEEAGSLGLASGTRFDVMEVRLNAMERRLAAEGARLRAREAMLHQHGVGGSRAGTGVGGGLGKHVRFVPEPATRPTPSTETGHHVIVVSAAPTAGGATSAPAPWATGATHHHHGRTSSPPGGNRPGPRPTPSLTSSVYAAMAQRARAHRSGCDLGDGLDDTDSHGRSAAVSPHAAAAERYHRIVQAALAGSEGMSDVVVGTTSDRWDTVDRDVAIAVRDRMEQRLRVKPHATDLDAVVRRVMHTHRKAANPTTSTSDAAHLVPLPSRGPVSGVDDARASTARASALDIIELNPLHPRATWTSRMGGSSEGEWSGQGGHNTSHPWLPHAQPAVPLPLTFTRGVEAALKRRGGAHAGLAGSRGRSPPPTSSGGTSKFLHAAMDVAGATTRRSPAHHTRSHGAPLSTVALEVGVDAAASLCHAPPPTAAAIVATIPSASPPPPPSSFFTGAVTATSRYIAAAQRMKASPPPSIPATEQVAAKVGMATRGCSAPGAPESTTMAAAVMHGVEGSVLVDGPRLPPHNSNHAIPSSVALPSSPTMQPPLPTPDGAPGTPALAAAQRRASIARLAHTVGYGPMPGGDGADRARKTVKATTTAALPPMPPMAALPQFATHRRRPSRHRPHAPPPSLPCTTNPTSVLAPALSAPADLAPPATPLPSSTGH